MSTVDRLLSPRGNVTRSLNRILSFPRVRVYNNSGASIATGTNIYVTWDAVEYDEDEMWDANLPTRLTAKTECLFHVHAEGQFAAAAANSLRQIQIQKNRGLSGTYFYRQENTLSIGGGFPDGVESNKLVYLQRGDFVEVQITQVSGGPLQFNGATLTNRLNGFEACMHSLP